MKGGLPWTGEQARQELWQRHQTAVGPSSTEENWAAVRELRKLSSLQSERLPRCRHGAMVAKGNPEAGLER